MDVIDADTIELGFRPRLRDSVVLVGVSDEAVLFDEISGALHQLDPIATVVCTCFDGSATLEEIVSDLAATFSADVEVVGRDVLKMTRGLGQLGVLHGVAGAGTEDVAVAGTEEPDPDGAC